MMTNNFPTIGEYNQLILHKGGSAFDILSDLEFVPSRSHPIRVFLFGSGTFAAVFKGKLNGSYYAIRCFLSAENETIERYRVNCNYLKYLNSEWITKCELIEDEMHVKEKWYPILKMDWVDGISIHKFVANNLNNKSVLTGLQEKLITISRDLEYNKIGHGDLQSGNMIISGNVDNFQIKLIDYDGMYVDGMPFSNAVEKGRSEFQHPQRTLNDYNYRIDRFSFWVFITALEALKFDSSLWVSNVQGGHNTDDNFLFTIKDFLNPSQSNLFNRLSRINSPSLNFYIEKLKYFCSSDFAKVSAPELSKEILSNDDSRDYGKRPEFQGEQTEDNINVPEGKFRVISNAGSLPILSTTFQKIGYTPIDLDKDQYAGKTLIVSNGRETKQVILRSQHNFYEINFS
jgi:hypothetical protein